MSKRNSEDVVMDIELAKATMNNGDKNERDDESSSTSKNLYLDADYESVPSNDESHDELDKNILFLNFQKLSDKLSRNFFFRKNFRLLRNLA